MRHRELFKTVNILKFMGGVHTKSLGQFYVLECIYNNSLFVCMGLIPKLTRLSQAEIDDFSMCREFRRFFAHLGRPPGQKKKLSALEGQKSRRQPRIFFFERVIWVVLKRYGQRNETFPEYLYFSWF